MPDPAILCCYAGICCLRAAKRVEAGAKLLRGYADEARAEGTDADLAMARGLMRDFALIPRSMFVDPDDVGQFEGGAA